MAAAVDVRYIHTTISADQPMASFRDQHATLAAHDASALREGYFDHARVQMIAASPGVGTGGWPDLVQLHELFFRLGHDFMFHDQDVTLCQRQLVMLHRVKKFFGQRVSWLDLIREPNRNNT